MDTVHPDSDWRGGGQTLFPAFSLPVATRDDWLIPLDRELILSGHGAGERSEPLERDCRPGRVWEEVADAGYSRAAFPFTFTDNFVGQARTGSPPSSSTVPACHRWRSRSPRRRHRSANTCEPTSRPWCPSAGTRVRGRGRGRGGRLRPGAGGPPALRPWSDLPNAQASWTTPATARRPPT